MYIGKAVDGDNDVMLLRNEITNQMLMIVRDGQIVTTALDASNIKEIEQSTKSSSWKNRLEHFYTRELPGVGYTLTTRRTNILTDEKETFLIE